jgi:three-Cys-motif partner protein
MAKRKKAKQDDLPFPDGLPELPEEDTEPECRRLKHPIWTENKAKLIERYLLYFVFVTHHGTYIDGFAGPQVEDQVEVKPEMWSAKLVLDSKPKWLRNFYLFDIDSEQIKRLEDLKPQGPEYDARGRKIPRKIVIEECDFNVGIHTLLDSNVISQTEATFCLLDQRTFQCHWSSVQALARYKTGEHNKIELFYFLAVGWLSRALTNTTRDILKLDKWWGGKDWDQLQGKSKPKQADIFVKRIKEEFSYKSVKAYPIFDHKEGGAIMYYMIHATDHPKAPKLMNRAYHKAVLKESYEQLEMEFGPPPDEEE